MLCIKLILKTGIMVTCQFRYRTDQSSQQTCQGHNRELTNSNLFFFRYHHSSHELCIKNSLSQIERAQPNF